MSRQILLTFLVLSFCYSSQAAEYIMDGNVIMNDNYGPDYAPRTPYMPSPGMFHLVSNSDVNDVVEEHIKTAGYDGGIGQDIEYRVSMSPEFDVREIRLAMAIEAELQEAAESPAKLKALREKLAKDSKAISASIALLEKEIDRKLIQIGKEKTLKARRALALELGVAADINRAFTMRNLNNAFYYLEPKYSRFLGGDFEGRLYSLNLPPKRREKLLKELRAPLPEGHLDAALDSTSADFVAAFNKLYFPKGRAVGSSKCAEFGSRLAGGSVPLQ